MKRLAGFLTVLGVMCAVFFVVAPGASAACQGQLGCDSGWIANDCYPGGGVHDNVNIRVIWRPDGHREVYWSGSFTAAGYAATSMNDVRIWASTPPNGSWVLKYEQQPGPDPGDYLYRGITVLSPQLPHNWQHRMADGYGNWCNTPQVLN